MRSFFFFSTFIDLEKLEGHLETKRQKQEDKIEPLVATLREIINKFHHTTDRLSNPSQVNFDDIQLTRFMERYSVMAECMASN